MKKIILSLIIPLTIISFFTITKWWYVLPIDGTESLFYGFPFPYYGDGWNTSMALQFFVLELIVDLIVYFFIWLFIFYLLNKFVIKIKPNKILSTFLWIISSILIIIFIGVGSMTENTFYINRDFKMEELDSGTKLRWKSVEIKDYYKHHSKKDN